KCDRCVDGRRLASKSGPEAPVLNQPEAFLFIDQTREWIVTDDKPVSQPDATIAAVDAAPRTESEPKRGDARSPSDRSTTGLWLVLIILIAALGGGAWFLWQAHQHHQQALSVLQDQVQQQQQDWEARQETIVADIDQQLAQERNNLRASVDDINQR